MSEVDARHAGSAHPDAGAPGQKDGRPREDPGGPRTALEVVRAGPSTLVQDRGRPGLARIGVGTAGAFDRGALALANRLVGNPEHAAGLEVLLGGMTVSADGDLWIALTGASGPVRIDGAAVAEHLPVLLPAGGLLEVDPAEHGVRRYLAIRGGVDVPPVLGSRSRDTLAVLGPEPVRDGDRLPIGPEPTTPVPAVDLVPVDAPPDGAVRLGLRPGPRHDWFADGTDELLLDARFAVDPRSDRTGLRLDGPALRRVRDGELPSEGMVPGALQVSPDGAITVLGPDAPVTGGYPVVAVVLDADLDRLAQLRPGQEVRFHLVSGRG